MQPNDIATVRLSLIAVGDRLRPLNDEAVERLAESIALTGLLQPIIITPDLDLIDGYHRLEACRKAGKTDIAVIFRDASEEENELAQIDSNLVREELTALERMQHLERRKALREAMLKPQRPRVKGIVGVLETSPCDNLVVSEISFTEETAALTGLSQRTIQRDLHTVESLTPEVQELVRETPIAESKHQLSALASIQTPERQKAVAAQAIDEGVTVQSLVNPTKPNAIDRPEPLPKASSSVRPFATGDSETAAPPPQDRPAYRPFHTGDHQDGEASAPTAQVGYRPFAGGEQQDQPEAGAEPKIEKPVPRKASDVQRLASAYAALADLCPDCADRLKRALA